MKCPICQNEMIKYTPGISEFYSCPKCEYSTPMVRTPIFFYLVSQSDKLMQENKCPFPLTPCYLRKEHGECTADPKDDSAYCGMTDRIKDEINQKLMDEVENLIIDSVHQLQPSPEQQAQYLKSIQFRMKKQQTLDQFGNSQEVKKHE